MYIVSENETEYLFNFSKLVIWPTLLFGEPTTVQAKMGVSATFLAITSRLGLQNFAL